MLGRQQPYGHRNTSTKGRQDLQGATVGVPKGGAWYGGARRVREGRTRLRGASWGAKVEEEDGDRKAWNKDTHPQPGLSGPRKQP